MNGNQAVNFLYLLLLLVLVGSAFTVRRMPIGKTLKIFSIWVLIFAVIFMVFMLKDDFRDLGARVLAERGGGPVTVDEDRIVRIKRGRDG